MILRIAEKKRMTYEKGMKGLTGKSKQKNPDGSVVEIPTLDFCSDHDLMVPGVKPHVRLCTDSTEPSRDSLSSSLSLPLPCSHVLSLSK